jgi:putative ABC transport system ATP-binding protein
MKNIVEIKNVSKIYKIGEKEFKALDNIDLSINQGEFVVILGPSGAGKSTLLNLIGGMDKPTEGSIKIDGEEISKYNESQLSEYRAENIGFIFQFYNINSFRKC